MLQFRDSYWIYTPFHQGFMIVLKYFFRQAQFSNDSFQIIPSPLSQPATSVVVVPGLGYDPKKIFFCHFTISFVSAARLQPFPWGFPCPGILYLRRRPAYNKISHL